jgi:hypothetical protein
VYNYGKRLLFDVTVPEPGTNFILAQTNAKDQGQSLVKPPPFTLTADQINEANYTLWAQKYEVSGLEPAPPPVKTVSKAIDATVSQGPHESSKSEALPIDDGYRAKYALFQRAYLGWVVDGENWRVLIGNNWIDARGGVGYVDMAGEIGSVAFAYEAYQIELLAATVEIFCERTERAYTMWQLKAHAAITQGYQAKLQAYEQALAQARAAAGTVIAGRNPAFNTQLVANELRSSSMHSVLWSCRAKATRNRISPPRKTRCPTSASSSRRSSGSTSCTFSIHISGDGNKPGTTGCCLTIPILRSEISFGLERPASSSP